MSLPVFQRTIVTEAGDVIAGAEVEVVLESTGLAADIFSDRAGNTSLTNPFFTGADGFAKFFAAPAEYRITATGPSGGIVFRFVVLTGDIARQDANAVAITGGSASLSANGLTVGTNQLVTSGNNVGIGTVQPDAGLDISAGSATTSSLAFTNNDNSTISSKFSMCFQVDRNDNVGGRFYDFKFRGKGFQDGTSLMTLDENSNLTIRPRGVGNLARGLTITSINTDSRIEMGVGVFASGRPFIGTNNDSNELQIGNRTSFGEVEFIAGNTIKSRIAANGQQSSVVVGSNVLAQEHKCRAYANFNGVGGVSIRASTSISSITRVGVGLYEINLALSLPDANYSVTGSCTRENINNPVAVFSFGNDFPTASKFRVQVGNTSNVLEDGLFVCVAIFR